MKMTDMEFNDEGKWTNEPGFAVEVIHEKLIHYSALYQIDQLLSLRGLEIIQFESGGDTVVFVITDR